MPACTSYTRAFSPWRSTTWATSISKSRFTRLVHQGVILGPDGARMSKSRGNVISPDAYTKYGSDMLRAYLGFGFSYIEGGPWNEDGIRSMHKFLSA